MKAQIDVRAKIVVDLPLGGYVTVDGQFFGACSNLKCKKPIVHNSWDFSYSDKSCNICAKNKRDKKE